MKKISNLLNALFLAACLLCFNTNVNAQYYKWAKSMGGSTNYDYSVKAISANDGSGDIFQIGQFQNTADFDPSVGVFNLISDGIYDISFAKYDSLGNLLWAKRIGSLTYDIATEMIQDAQGNIILLGYFEGVVDFDPSAGVSNQTAVGGSDAFIAKYDKNGNFIWVKTFGGTLNDQVSSSQMNSIGEFYLTGMFQGTADLDPGAGVSNFASAGGHDIFIAKFDSTGNYVWAKTMGNSTHDWPTKLKIDSSDNIYLEAFFLGTLDIDPGAGVSNITSLGSQDFFIAKYDLNGNYVWGNRIGGINYDVARDMVLDSDANIYITGNYHSTVDFDPGPGVANGTLFPSQNIFLAKYDENGFFKWVKTMGSMNEEVGYCLAIDSAQNVYLGGGFRTIVDFDPGVGIANLVADSVYSADDIFLAKYDSTGNYIWAKSFTGSDDDRLSSIEIDATGQIILSGYIRNVCDMDPSLAVNSLDAGGPFSDMFLGKYSQTPCSSVFLQINSFSDISCSSPGVAITQVINGTSNYNFLWNTFPVQTDSTVYISSPGIYSVIATDTNGCTLNRSFLFNGPSLISFDLNSNLISQRHIPGVTSMMQLDGYNAGCVLATGQLQLILDTVLSYVSAIPSPSSISGDTLVWDFSNLAYDSLHINPTIYVNTSIYASLGDSLKLKTIITPISADIDTTNNIKEYDFLVFGSYDPNIKSVYPQGEGSEGDIFHNLKMTYTVQFQNTGTSDAINIYILDTLNSNLDLQTVQVVGSSHSMITEVLPGNVLKFKFDNINLPDSTSNEPLSHGYLIYEINQNPNLINGTQLTNTAHIYFDYNSAIVTNTVLNTIELCSNFSQPSVFDSANVLTALPSNVIYQWVNCPAMDTIAGAASQIYTPTANGSYAVMVTDTNGCTSFSNCVTVSNIGISINELPVHKIYPNPITNDLTVELSHLISSGKIEIVDVQGRLILSRDIDQSMKYTLNFESVNSGIYFLKVIDSEKGNANYKIIKN